MSGMSFGVNAMSEKSHIMRKPVNKKGADQPAHSRSLISTFVVHCIDSIISLVSMYKISRWGRHLNCVWNEVRGLYATPPLEVPDISD